MTAVNGTAVYHLDDDTLRWHNDTRLDANEYAEAKRLGFRLWRGAGAWVATWAPSREDFLLQQVEGIDHEADPDDPGARIERFAGRSVNAAARAAGRFQSASNAVAGIPAGQPILQDHPSGRRHRRALETHDQHMRAGQLEREKADYWKRRAQGAARRAREKADPGVIRRRIEKLEADLRRHQRAMLSLDEQSSKGTSETNLAASRRYTQRWLDHLGLRLAFERTRLETLNPLPFAAATSYRAGDVVKAKRYGKCRVLRIGPKNVRVEELAGPTKGWKWLVPPHELEPWTDPEVSTPVD